MYRRVVTVSVLFTFIFILLFTFVYAGEQNFGSVKVISQGVSYEADDNCVKTDQQNEVQNYRGFLYKPLEKDPMPQKAAFIRLKPRTVNNGEAKGQIIYDIEFTDSAKAGKTIENGSDDKPYVAIQKVENIDKSNFMKKETAKENKTEVSLGFKLSSLSEICLGKGFLVERKDNSSIQTHDDGWRIKFKTNF